MIELSDDQIDELLTPEPIQYFDKEERCVSRGCGSPTHRTLYGIRYCFPHILDKCNDLLKEKDKHAKRS